MSAKKMFTFHCVCVCVCVGFIQFSPFNQKQTKKLNCDLKYTLACILYSKYTHTRHVKWCFYVITTM